MTANYPEADHIYPAFAMMLDNVEVEDKGCVGDTAHYLVCQSCSEELCLVEDGDSMRTLLNTALAHKCPPVPKHKKNRR